MESSLDEPMPDPLSEARGWLLTFGGYEEPVRTEIAAAAAVNATAFALVDIAESLRKIANRPLPDPSTSPTGEV
jgi:hypothetical protein